MKKSTVHFVGGPSPFWTVVYPYPAFPCSSFPLQNGWLHLHEWSPQYYDYPSTMAHSKFPCKSSVLDSSILLAESSMSILIIFEYCTCRGSYVSSIVIGKTWIGSNSAKDAKVWIGTRPTDPGVYCRWCLFIWREREFSVPPRQCLSLADNELELPPTFHLPSVSPKVFLLFLQWFAPWFWSSKRAQVAVQSGIVILRINRWILDFISIAKE